MALALDMSSSNGSSVTISDGVLMLCGFCDSDPDVVRTIEAHDDPELAVRACLQIGARALRATQATVDTGIVEKAFAALVADFERAASDNVERVIASTDTLVGGEEATIPRLLRSILTETVDKVAGLFDPDSRSSAVALLEETFCKAADDHLAATRRALDPGNDDSPLGRWKTEVIETLRQQLGLVLTQVTEVAAAVAARDARTEVRMFTAGKGFDLEERLHIAVSEIACRYGDLAERVGTSSGAGGSKVGDETVQLNPDDTCGRPLAVVFEAKARKLPMARTFSELDRAMTNREAQAGVAVFDRVANSPTGVPFTYFDNKAIVVLEDGPDIRLLELAYLWARFTVRKAAAEPADGLDPARIGEAIADIQRAMQKASVIRRGLSSAGNGIRQAGEQLDSMDLDIAEALMRLRQMLAQ